MYKIYKLEDKKGKIIKEVRKFDWKRDLPGGWLDYGPPRKVTGYGDGSLIDSKSVQYGKCWKFTSWSGSVPYTNTTCVTKTKKIPQSFLDTGILNEVRKSLKLFKGKVDDSTGTGLWCNYYESPTDHISAHKDNENYYERNFENEPIFVSLTLYEDEKTKKENLARFQIKKDGKWETVELEHLTLLVMSGEIEHRVLKPLSKKFRKRYNITFRTPVKRTKDIIKNFRFFSNFGRYYRPTYILFVPDLVFMKDLPKEMEKVKYIRDKNIAVKNSKEYKIINDKSNYTKVLKRHSQYSQIYLIRNLNLSREELLKQIKPKENNPPSTTTNLSLLVLLSEIKNIDFQL